MSTTHFESSEFVCARSSGDELVCGSCSEEIGSAPGNRAQGRHDVLASHYRKEHPEQRGSGRFRDRTIGGVRFYFFA